MRRNLVLGVGLAALVGGGTAAGQFAVDRPVSPTSPAAPAGAPKAAPPALPGGIPSAAPGAGGFEPVMPASPARPAQTGSSGYTPLYSSPPPAATSFPAPGGLRPASYASVAPGQAVGPAVDFAATPVDVEMPLAMPKDHPWRIQPEHGPWFILVKSYVRPPKGSRAAQEDRGLTALELGEALAKEVREEFRVQAFLFEYVSDERKAEHRAVVAARQKARNEYLSQVRELEKRARLQGLDFAPPDNKLHVLRHESRDQIGVLVGGFQTEADARKALAQVKKWPPPKNELLMDGGTVVKPGPDGKPVVQSTRLNPYPTAFVVPNPSAARDAAGHAARPAVDPFIVKLNEGNPYNLLKAKKGWTLAVKSFASPVEIVNKNADSSLMRKFGWRKGADVLAAGAEQAEAMAKAIRAMTGPGGQPLNLEAFVLHTRTASLVTVGQFDGPDDPALLATKRLLSGITTRVSEDPTGLRPVAKAPTLFENVGAMPIPKPE
jgi:hypothetical protein